MVAPPKPAKPKVTTTADDSFSKSILEGMEKDRERRKTQRRADLISAGGSAGASIGRAFAKHGGYVDKKRVMKGKRKRKKGK